MIKVNKIEPFTCEFFTPKNESLGFLNEYEFNDLRMQILDEGIEGYYGIYNGIRINISSDGSVRPWPQGFYDLLPNQLNYLFGI